MSSAVSTFRVVFKLALVSAYVQTDHCHRARGKLRKLSRTTSIDRYLSGYMNITLTIRDINDGGMVHEFIDGQNHKVEIEVLNASCDTFEECARILFTIDSVISRADMR